MREFIQNPSQQYSGRGMSLKAKHEDICFSPLLDVLDKEDDIWLVFEYNYIPRVVGDGILAFK